MNLNLVFLFRFFDEIIRWLTFLLLNVVKMKFLLFETEKLNLTSVRLILLELQL